MLASWRSSPTSTSTRSTPRWRSSSSRLGQAARRRRRPTRPRRRLDRELRRAPLRHPLGDELRRGTPSLPGRRICPPASHALPRVLAGRVGLRARGRAERRADGARRGLPRPRRGRGRLPARAGARRGRADVGARGHEPDVLAGRRPDESRRQGRVRLAQAGGRHGRARGHEAAFLAPLAVRKLPGVGPRAERLLAAGIETVGELAALDDDALRALLPGKTGLLLRERARGIDPRGSRDGERISISHEETFERDVDERELSARGATTDVGAPRRTPRSRRPIGADGDDEAALQRLLDPVAVARRSTSESTMPRRSATRLPLLDRALGTGPAPSDSSASASRASRISGSCCLDEPTRFLQR